MIHLRAGMGLVLGALLAIACSVNPVTGEREFLILSPEDEARIGRESAQQVEREIGLYGAPELSDYVSRIGSSLAVHSPRRDVSYAFAIVDMPEVNAFALPGGYIYVSRGLLALVNDEAELANVLAHEIGHVAARHHAQRQTRATGVSVASAIGSILAGRAGGDTVGGVVSQVSQVAGAGLIASYGRDQERQSDRVGQKIAASAGYSAAGMSEFLQSLEAESRLSTGEARAPSFLDSHPSTPERVQSTAALARELGGGARFQIASDRAEFVQRLDGLLLGVDPAGGIFVGTRFLHPGLDLTLQFPEGWLTRNAEASVTAVAPDGNSLVRLVARGPGSDPRAAAARDASRGNLNLVDGRSAQIGGFPAFRARTTASVQGGVTLAVDLTWILYRGQIYRIDGLTPERLYARLSGTFERAARSFRPLSSRERASIRVRRLRVVRARRGETLAGLSSRSGNAWSVERTAVMNRLRSDRSLAAGEPIKIAVETRYAPPTGSTAPTR